MMEHAPHRGSSSRGSSHRSTSTARLADDDARALRNAQGRHNAPAEDKAEDSGGSVGSTGERRRGDDGQEERTLRLYTSERGHGMRSQLFAPDTR